MHKQQLKALIDYHKKAEKAYRGIGDLQKAERQSRRKNGLRKNKKRNNAKESTQASA